MKKEPKVYVIGRHTNHSTADILIPKSEDTVGRNHIDLTVTADGRYYINEPAETTNGTFAFINGQWERVKASFVEFDTPIKLGHYETSARKLLSMLQAASEPPPIPHNYVPQPKADTPSATREPYWDDEAGKMRYE